MLASQGQQLYDQVTFMYEAHKFSHVIFQIKPSSLTTHTVHMKQLSFGIKPHMIKNITN